MGPLLLDQKGDEVFGEVNRPINSTLTHSLPEDVGEKSGRRRLPEGIVRKVGRDVNPNQIEKKSKKKDGGHGVDREVYVYIVG